MSLLRGVAIVVARRALESPAGWRTVALGLAGVAGLAGGTLYFRRFCEGVPLLAATTVQVSAGAILTAMLALAFERMHAVWTAPAGVFLVARAPGPPPRRLPVRTAG